MYLDRFLNLLGELAQRILTHLTTNWDYKWASRPHAPLEKVIQCRTSHITPRLMWAILASSLFSSLRKMSMRHARLWRLPWGCGKSNLDACARQTFGIEGGNKCNFLWGSVRLFTASQALVRSAGTLIDLHDWSAVSVARTGVCLVRAYLAVCSFCRASLKVRMTWAGLSRGFLSTDRLANPCNYELSIQDTDTGLTLQPVRICILNNIVHVKAPVSFEHILFDEEPWK